jgi:hypothetical protein
MSVQHEQHVPQSALTVDDETDVYKMNDALECVP